MIDLSVSLLQWTYQANTFFLPKKSIADISSDGPVKDFAEDLCHRRMEDGGQNRCTKLVHNIDAFKSFFMVFFLGLFVVFLS